ncbi:MAG: right-handed parallel beta-helix repeat-containing protein [Methanobrevibacter sp.]|jgi:parallel beta-helix repeat protein|nr:right-handed parallel beta-helix repeat-containing protein [Candidatus Methanoflexus mossambicus]
MFNINYNKNIDKIKSINFKKIAIAFLIVISLVSIFSLTIGDVNGKTYTIHNITQVNNDGKVDGIVGFSGSPGEIVSNTRTNTLLQAVIDYNMEFGDTLYLPDKYYTHLSLNVNKPINLIGNNTFIEVCHSNGVIAGESDHKVLFYIGKDGAGSNISKFIISNPFKDDAGNSIEVEGYSVFLNNTNNVKLDNNDFDSLGRPVKVLNSDNIIIKNSLIHNGINGMNITNSSNIFIEYNSIYNNTYGIVFYGNNTNIKISNNNISRNTKDGIVLETPFAVNKNFLIYYNYIDENSNSGIRINSEFPNLNISSNMINYNGMFGIFFDFDANKTQQPIVEDNLIYDNKGYSDNDGEYKFEVQRVDTSHADRSVLILGYNFYAASNNQKSSAGLCAKTSTDMIIVEINQVSNGIFKITYKYQDTNEIVKNLINHENKIILNNNSNTYHVLIINGEGTIDLRNAKYLDSGNLLMLTFGKSYFTFNIDDSNIPKVENSNSNNINNNTNTNNGSNVNDNKNNNVNNNILNIATSISKTQVVKGNSIIYKITIKNTGTEILNGLILSNLSPKLQILVSKYSHGYYNVNLGVWTITNLDSGAIATLSLTVKANKVGTFKNTVKVSGIINKLGKTISLKVLNPTNIKSYSPVDKKSGKYLIRTYKFKNTGDVKGSKTFKFTINKKIINSLKLNTLKYKGINKKDWSFNTKTNKLTIKVKNLGKNALKTVIFTVKRR